MSEMFIVRAIVPENGLVRNDEKASRDIMVTTLYNFP